ncbi:MAG: hypothetical protein K6F99_10840, partial [Lachnospiraceae bacterium]|nr:hypothetical protein [Lachnospiraceae bacterium]
MVNIKRKRKIITMSLVFLMILFNVFVPGPEPGLNEKSEIRIKQKYTTVYAGEIVSENNKTNEEEQTDEEKEEIVEDDQAAVSKDDPGKNVPSADGLPKEIIPEDDNTSGGNEEIQNRSGMAHTDQILEVDNGPLAPVITEYTISYPEDTQEEYTPWELLTITAYESHDGSPVKYIRWSSAGYGKDGWYEIDKNPDKLSFLITSNVTHRVIIKTEKGNEGYMTFRFPKIDGTWPVIIKEGNNNIRLKMKQPVYNGKCKEAVLSIVAEDHELGLHEKAYLFADFEDAYKAAYEKPLADSYESGTFWQASNEFVISENKEYGGYVRDKAGNIRISFRNIDCIDNTSPSAVAEEIYKPYGGFISEDRIVVSDVKDNPGGAGIPDKCFSWDHGEWTDENEFVVKKNGPVSLRVRDGLDNITEKILEIDHNFDVDPPVLEPIDVKPTVSYGNVVGGVWLRAEAIDDNSQAEGLSYSFDGGQTWTSSSVMEVSKNGTYTIITRDITGNVSEPRRVIISNIDNKGPVIAEPKLSYGRRAGGYYKDVTIKVSADDAQAVLNEKPYSFNGGEFSEEDSYT